MIALMIVSGIICLLSLIGLILLVMDMVLGEPTKNNMISLCVVALLFLMSVSNTIMIDKYNTIMRYYHSAVPQELWYETYLLYKLNPNKEEEQK